MSTSSNNNSFVCPVFVSSDKCNQDALKVMQQFKNFYERKLNEIDVDGGGDCLELKLKVQRRWIEDLTEQTQMMARIVKELEDEATNRVRLLEDKLRQTSKSAYEVMKRYQTYSISHNLDEHFQKVFYLENDLKNLLEFLRRVRDDNKWSIEGLRFYDVTYRDLYGKDQSNCRCDDKSPQLIPITNGVNKQEAPPGDETREEDHTDELLKKKDQEYEELRQSMWDMRSALTEEVACKHDIISSLKKDVQQLEERCVQADKQTAFKDDIIKELRKEIKQLKQQKKEKDTDLAKQLEEAKASLKRMKPCVETKTKYTDMEEQLVIKKSKLLQNKDDIIQIQTDTLSVIDLELQVSKKKEKELEVEIFRRQVEVEELKCKCKELEKTLASSQGCAENLQKAVDLYLNSINVLEAAEERARIEIEQQKVTIVNLQEALVGVKMELDEVRQNNQQEVGHYQYLCNVFYVNLLDLEEVNKTSQKEISLMSESYKKLQDCSLELEIEHFNALQDLALLETHLYKYQTESRRYEEERNPMKVELKKLRHQNRSYEHVVNCFKHEMVVMSEQLAHLQEILNLSNKSSKVENCQLYNAVVELQQFSEKLKHELCDNEKKFLIATQKSQLKDAKIDELQLIIGQKNADLNVHDEAINEMKMRLEHALLENQDLQNTIGSLNSTIMQLQCWQENREVERSRRSRPASRRSHSECREDYDKKSRKLDKLQAEYKDQYQVVKTLQKEVENVKEKSKEKMKNLKRQNEELKEKLATSELSKQHLLEQLTHLKEQIAHCAERDCCREHELAQSKQVILDLRQTMIDLNDGLDGEMPQLPEDKPQGAQDNREPEDIYMSCRMEMNMYKKIADNFKEALAEAKRKLKELETRNRSLADEVKCRENKICEIQKRVAKREEETCQCIEELTKKLKESEAEEKRLSFFIDTLEKNVQKKLEEKREADRIAAQRVVINCCECNDMTTTQQEIHSLKIEIKGMIQNQLALNNENDKLLKQVTVLQTKLSTVEEKYFTLKAKHEKLQCENKCLKERNKTLLREKEVFSQTIKSLEQELADCKNDQDDLCAESRCVVNNVKAWLEEQKKINKQVKKKAQCYCEKIAQLKQEKEALLMTQPLAQSSFKPQYDRNYRPCTPVDCPNWSLGSQGDESEGQIDDDGPSCNCSVEEWYSPTYRDDDTDEYHEEQFLSTIEAVTQELQNNNRKWKGRCQECVVSKDGK